VRRDACAVRLEQAEHQHVVGDDTLGDLRDLFEDLPYVESLSEGREQLLERRA
jgi:hypothetical protein